jgi:hypothetical protein
MRHSKKSKPEAESKKHSDFNASGSERWLECPGSLLFCRGMESEDSDASKQGTAAHELAAASLIARVCPTKLRIRGKVPDECLPLIDDEMRHYIKKFFDFVVPYFDKGEVLIETKFDLSWIDPKSLVPYEKRYEVPEGKFTMYGTGDVVVVEPWGDIHVIDLKYGHKMVEADQNSQLAYYGLGAAKQVDWDFGDAHLHIFQPRRDHFPKWSLPASELMKWVNKFYKGIQRAKSKDAQLRAGDWCKFCPGLATCPAARAAVEEQIQSEFDDEKGGALVIRPQRLTPVQVAAVLDRAPMIADWLESIETQAFHLLQKGIEVPGYKLVAKKGSRVWKDPVGLAKKFSSMDRDDLFTEPVLKSPAQAEKILGKKWVSKHTTHVSSGSTIAKVSDKRSEVRAKIETDFED